MSGQQPQHNDNTINVMRTVTFGGTCGVLWTHNALCDRGNNDYYNIITIMILLRLCTTIIKITTSYAPGWRVVYMCVRVRRKNNRHVVSRVPAILPIMCLNQIIFISRTVQTRRKRKKRTGRTTMMMDVHISFLTADGVFQNRLNVLN